MTAIGVVDIAVEGFPAGVAESLVEIVLAALGVVVTGRPGDDDAAHGFARVGVGADPGLESAVHLLMGGGHAPGHDLPVDLATGDDQVAVDHLDGLRAAKPVAVVSRAVVPSPPTLVDLVAVELVGEGGNPDIATRNLQGVGGRDRGGGHDVGLVDDVVAGQPFRQVALEAEQGGDDQECPDHRGIGTDKGPGPAEVPPEPIAGCGWRGGAVRSHAAATIAVGLGGPGAWRVGRR